MKRGLIWTLAVAAAIAAFYWWAAMDNRVPEDARWELDIGAVRRLAVSLPGVRPLEVRTERVAAFAFPRAMIAAGDGWSTDRMDVFSYQLVYPDHTAVVDTAMPRELAAPKFMVPFYDDQAFQRVQRALDAARWIAVTHEHADHIGGLTRHPRLRERFPALRLSQAQLAEPGRMMEARPPDGSFDGYAPLQYQRMAAIDHGVVLIAAPGHTPGSQLVYVQRADGRELLLLGDVAWKLRAVHELKQRPRWVTGALIREDRDAVYGQLKALQALSEQDPAVRLVPGHDGAVIEALVADGTLERGFAP